MKSLGLEDEEIKEFADVNYWLQYFPPKTEADLRVKINSLFIPLSLSPHLSFPLSLCLSLSLSLCLSLTSSRLICRI